MKIWGTHPMETRRFLRGEGAWLYDRAGRATLDLLSGTWSNVLGHAHPRWVEAVSRQVGELAHLDPAHLGEVTEEALQALRGVLPDALERVVFLSTGSEGVELAVKMARAATGARELAVVEGAYFGATNTALELSEAGRDARYLAHGHPPLRLPVPRAASGEYAWDHALTALEARVREVESGGEPLAAVLVEPILANAGVVVPPTGFLPRLAELARRAGALLLADEVTTGLGRTGRWFALDHEGVVPDLLVLGKALGGGLPVAAVATSEEVEARCDARLVHVQSHQNDPLSAAVATAVIRILTEEKLVERSARLGQELLAGLGEVASRQPAIREVRGRGLLAGVELQPELTRVGARITAELGEEGFLVNYQPARRCIRLLPPFVIESAELGRFVAAFEAALERGTETR